MVLRTAAEVDLIRSVCILDVVDAHVFHSLVIGEQRGGVLVHVVLSQLLPERLLMALLLDLHAVFDQEMGVVLRAVHLGEAVVVGLLLAALDVLALVSLEVQRHRRHASSRHLKFSIWIEYFVLCSLYLLSLE